MSNQDAVLGALQEGIVQGVMMAVDSVVAYNEGHAGMPTTPQSRNTAIKTILLDNGWPPDQVKYWFDFFDLEYSE